MKAAALLPQAGPKARAQQEEADRLRAEAEALRDRARLEGLSIWVMEKVKRTKKGSRTCYYWMAYLGGGKPYQKCASGELCQYGCGCSPTEGQSHKGRGPGDEGLNIYANAKL